MKAKILDKAIIALSMALTLGLSACTGCSTHNWSSSESEISSVEPESSSEPVQTYKIRWLNYDGSLLYTSRDVREGELPVYGGKTPTRESDAQYSYVWDGWTPEVVPATKNTSYKATYTSETRTYTIYFDQKNENVGYTQDKIENVPYGSSIDIDFDTITINGVSVSPINNYPEEEKRYFNIDFESWNVAPNTIVTGDMEIQAFYTQSTRMYDLSVVPVGDCKIQYAGDDDVYHDTDGGYFAEKVKSYVGEVTVSSDPITHLSLQSPIGSQYFRVYFAAVPLEDPFFEYEFDGWYCDGELLTGSKYVFGDVEIEARFTSSRKDFSHIFEYEYDNLRREAIIVGIKEEYQHTRFPTISIPDYVNGGWAVTAVKNGTMAKVEGLQELYIPNTLLYFEEMPDSATFPQYLRSITLEEGNTHFHLMEGILYNYDLTEILVGTTEMSSYLENNRLAIPEMVTHIWSRAFWYRDIEGVYLPSGLTEITNYCFYANDLDGLTLPEGITRIGAGAFACNDMTSVSFPDACKTIESNAFENCSELKSVWIGKYTEDISRYAFMGCKKIELYYVDPDNVHYASYENAIYNKYLTTLYFYPCIFSDDPSEKLAPTLEAIFAMAFQNCHFTTFHIPEGVTRVYGSALYYCSELTEIYFPISIQQVGWAAFSCCYEVNYAYYPGTVEQWEALTGIDVYWGQTLRNLQVLTCSDGTVEVKKFNA